MAKAGELKAAAKSLKTQKADIVIVSDDFLAITENRVFVENQIFMINPSTRMIILSELGNSAAGLLDSPIDYINKNNYKLLTNLLEGLTKQIDVKKDIIIETMPRFSISVNGEKIEFKHKKCEELLAFLCDNNGNEVSKTRIIDALWTPESYTPNKYRNTGFLLIKTLRAYGIEYLLVRRYEAKGLAPHAYSSDLKDILEGRKNSLSKYKGKYMEGYKWNQKTKLLLENLVSQQKRNKEQNL